MFVARLLLWFVLGGMLLRVAAAGAPEPGEVIAAADATKAACSVGSCALMFAGRCSFASGAVIIIVP